MGALAERVEEINSKFVLSFQRKFLLTFIFIILGCGKFTCMLHVDCQFATGIPLALKLLDAVFVCRQCVLSLISVDQVWNAVYLNIWQIFGGFFYFTAYLCVFKQWVCCHCWEDLCNRWVEQTGPLACLSPFSFACWIRSINFFSGILNFLVKFQDFLKKVRLVS